MLYLLYPFQAGSPRASPRNSPMTTQKEYSDSNLKVRGYVATDSFIASPVSTVGGGLHGNHVLLSRWQKGDMGRIPRCPHPAGECLAA